jgi:DNA polymerase-3 subunit delta'
LPTIRSRLVEVTFAPLDVDDVAAVLEREGVAPEAARAAAAIAGGSTTRARGLLGGEGTTREAAVGWFFAALEGEPIEPAWATRPTLEEGLEVIKTLTRDWLVLTLGEPALPLLAPDQAERLAALRRREPAALARTLAALGDAERIARTNVSPALVADLARMALTATSG